MKRLCLLAAAATLFAAPAFAQDNTITIGYTKSQTGPLNVNSLGQSRGYQFWRDEVNACGYLGSSVLLFYSKKIISKA